MFANGDKAFMAEKGEVLADGGSMEAGYEFADGFEGGLAVDFEVFEDDGSGGVGVCFIPFGLTEGGRIKEVSLGHCHGEGFSLVNEYMKIKAFFSKMKYV